MKGSSSNIGEVIFDFARWQLSEQRKLFSVLAGHSNGAYADNAYFQTSFRHLSFKSFFQLEVDGRVEKCQQIHYDRNTVASAMCLLYLP